MRLDHIAFRVFNRDLARRFISSHYGYKTSNDFRVDFPDNTYANCYVLSPSERTKKELPLLNMVNVNMTKNVKYHMAPEIFISEGSKGSIVEKWVKENKTKLHHLAYQVDNVDLIMKMYKKRGILEFTSNEPLKCDGLTQIFTKPCPITGLIYEFIERENGKEGFCIDNVKNLMETTKNL